MTQHVNICQWTRSDAVLVCMSWYNIATGLLNTTQKIFQRFIQQISADLNFSGFFMQGLNLCRFSLPLTTYDSDPSLHFGREVARGRSDRSGTFWAPWRSSRLHAANSTSRRRSMGKTTYPHAQVLRNYSISVISICSRVQVSTRRHGQYFVVVFYCIWLTWIIRHSNVEWTCDF